MITSRLFIFMTVFGTWNALFAMDHEPVSFSLLPTDVKKVVFEHAMIAEPYQAWRLACVCKSWKRLVNNRQLTERIVNRNPTLYAYSFKQKTFLQTRELEKYIRVTGLFANMMEHPVTKEMLNDLFCSVKHPYKLFLVCNPHDPFPLHYACQKGNSVGVSSLLKRGVIPTKSHFDLTLGLIKTSSNAANAEPHLKCFKLLCTKNLTIARSSELLFELHFNFAKKTERFYRLLTILIEAGTDLNQRDKDDDTLLDQICYLYLTRPDQEPYKKILILCLQHGVDPHIQPRNDKSVYDFAKEADQPLFELIKTHYKPVKKNCS